MDEGRVGAAKTDSDKTRTDQGLPWIVACLGPGTDTAHDLREVHALTSAEAAAALNANGMLHSITSPDSPYGRLESHLDAFDRGVADAINSMEKGPLVRPDPPLNERFNNILNAFRVFLDHTPHRLRTQFGRQSATEEAFRTACSQEYDRAFEYRLAYNLRNASQHRSDVLQVTYGKRLGSAPRVEATISDEVLDAALKDTKWQARVRTELKAYSRPIQAADLLLVLRGCVQRIFFRTLLAERSAIETAVHTIQALAEGVACAGELAFVASALPDSEIPAARVKLKIQRLELEAANTVAAALREGERLVWPRFAIQVSLEWLETPATDALLSALADDLTVQSAVVSLVENVGAFVGVGAPSAYTARSAVARAIVRSRVRVEDQRSGPAHPLP